MSDHQTMISTDLVILGAGCAGLSLAYQLAIKNVSLDITLVDTRTSYENDRTWSGFNTTPHAFEDCRIGKWKQLEVAIKGNRTQFDCGRYFYESISAGSFYQKCLAIIDANSRITRHHGRVTATDSSSESPIVTLKDGRKIKTAYVIDTLPRPVPLTAPWRWQDFAGWEIESETLASMPPLLMDFSVANPDEITFLYRLPFDQSRVLLEWTTFARPATNPFALEQELQRYLEQLNISDYRIVRKEYGSLPMAPPSSASKSPRIIHAGAYAGSMRASTGYAFHAIQHWAEECATCLSVGKSPVQPKRSLVLDKLDSIYMNALDKEGANASRLYYALFSQCPEEALIRFLSGSPSFVDFSHILRSLPTSIMLKAAFPG